MIAIELDESVLRRLFDDGVPLVEIAEYFGCSRSPICNAIDRMGLTRPQPHPRFKGPPPNTVYLDDEEIRRLFEAGVPLEMMAEHLGCGRTRVAKSVRQLGLTRPTPPRGLRGEASPHWRGGRRITAGGYFRVLVGEDYPGAGVSGHIFEHRLVMQRALGRTLRDDEVVHHINGIKTDNRPENLVVMTRVEHNEHHKRLRRRAQRLKKEGKDAGMQCAGAL